MTRSFVVLGGTGDLTGRLLLPSLARLYETGALPDGTGLLAVAREDWDDDAYRDWARDRLAAHAGDLPDDAHRRLLDRLHYARADVTDPADLRAALAGVDTEPVVYLALPHTLFHPVVTALTDIGLPEGARLVVEKPFGADLTEARALNELLHGLLPEEAVFRVDHFLAKQTVLNVLGLRFANRVFEPIWNAAHIERVEIVADETLGLEGRAGYYDSAGALRDMVQNHLLQLLAIVAMEPPLALDATSLPARKADVLRAVRPADPRTGSVRGRYTAGRAGGRELPDYAAEDGVDPARQTETFAELTVTVDNWRWAGVPFHLRTGKALGADRQEIVVRFRPVPHLPFLDAEPEPDVLRLTLSPDAIALELNLNGAGDPFDLEREVLGARLAPHDLPAYGLLLRELLDGDTTLSISDVEAEEGWRIVEPVLAAWAAGEVPLLEYPAGSDGPGDRTGVQAGSR
ncbi:glucose-6-phosphate dehydrogenase [Trujillonella humicola]|uniref:glucose-6-phosphate dehydrogenase n=1 Tax=Trujillonella humicola TaxID=3383699 RepID=UPI00390682BB